MLENADVEDEEDEYDWYTFPAAIRKLDARVVAGLQTMAVLLIERANVGLLPCKWGGVFGQELHLSIAEDESATIQVSGLTVEAEPWIVEGEDDSADDLQELAKRIGGTMLSELINN